MKSQQRYRGAGCGRTIFANPALLAPWRCMMADAQPKLQRWEQRTEWPLAVAAVAFLTVYSIQVLARPHGGEARLLWAVSWIVWGLFVIDYIARLSLASDRWRWFLRHLFDLAIVALPLLRPLRLLRLVVLLGALGKAVGDAIRGRIIVYTVFGLAMLIYAASLGVLDKERDQPGATINSFGKALWWSITTVTTVGYGDLAPVTVAGRFIAISLMLGGISLVGVVTASIASWIVQRVAETESASNAATAEQIDELRNEIRNLAELIHKREGPPTT
jgi:voltage-gated potassium channel